MSFKLRKRKQVDFEEKLKWIWHEEMHEIVNKLNGAGGKNFELIYSLPLFLSKTLVYMYVQYG